MLRVSSLAALSLAAILTAAPAARPQGVVAVPVPPPTPGLTGEQIFALGTLEGRTYTNRHFGITLTAPEGWTVADLAELRAIREKSRAMVAGEKDETVRRQWEATVGRTTTLFSARKLRPDSAAGAVAALVCAAERVPSAVVKTPRDYYDVLLRSMKVSQQFDAEVLEGFKTMRIGATEFGVFTIRFTSPRGVSIQKQLISVKGSYALGIVMSYRDEGDATAAFEELVASIRTR